VLSLGLDALLAASPGACAAPVSPLAASACPAAACPAAAASAATACTVLSPAGRSSSSTTEMQYGDGATTPAVLWHHTCLRPAAAACSASACGPLSAWAAPGRPLPFPSRQNSPPNITLQPHTHSREAQPHCPCSAGLDAQEQSSLKLGHRFHILLGCASSWLWRDTGVGTRRICMRTHTRAAAPVSCTAHAHARAPAVLNHHVCAHQLPHLPAWMHGTAAK
jgi:hypothetical protein